MIGLYLLLIIAGSVVGDCGCGARDRTAPGALLSPNFPAGYACNNLQCSWLLSGGGVYGHRVSIQFPQFQVESGYDILRIYDGFTTADTLIGHYCDSVTSSGNFMLVTYTTDGSTPWIFTGFNATFSGVIPPTQPPPPNMNWWKQYPIYQIYPRSFQDTNGDGTGDLQGIISRLDYLSWLGIKVIWLNPIYNSPMKDFGYDISNFTSIDPLFGTIGDFDNLVTALHSRGMYLIMDFVPNHSSDQHPWFQKSLQSIAPYTDYYVWKQRKQNGDPVNNWISVFGNSSWEWRAERSATYLHEFLVAQPDLNYRSAALRAEMQDVLNFWMERGVDGFRCDAVIYMLENDTFADEPRSNDPNALPNENAYLNHTMTIDQPGTYTEATNWINSFKKFGAAHGKHIFNVYEGYTDMDHVMEFYKIGADFPFNFNLIPLDEHTSTTQLSNMISNWMVYMREGWWPNWVLGNHDNHRVGTRMGGRQYTDALNMLLLLLPGTPTVYYGDELGMLDVWVPFNVTVDPAGKKWGPELFANFSRDPERTPMQWDAGPNAGFTSNKSGGWLPLAHDFRSVNVAVQKTNPLSHLNIFRALLKLRLRPTFQMGTNSVHGFPLPATPSILANDLFSFARIAADEGGMTYIICINIGHDAQTLSFSMRSLWRDFYAERLNALEGHVEVATPFVQVTLGTSNLQPNTPITLNNGDGIVFSFNNCPTCG